MAQDHLSEGRPHILVVDDDERLRTLLTRYLADNGFVVTATVDAAAARDVLDYLSYDLIVLDVMMPGEDGLSLTRSLKESGNDTPILLLTALSETSSRISGLEAGADDYLPKPFEPQELLLRINAILRRVAKPAAQPGVTKDGNSFGAWTFDAEKGELSNDDGRILLTQAELTLFKALASRAGQVIGREELAELCGLTASERTIDVQITRLRKKLGDDPKQPRHIQTIRGKGYILWVT